MKTPNQEPEKPQAPRPAEPPPVELALRFEQRLHLAFLVRQQTGNVEKLQLCFGILDKLGISPADYAYFVQPSGDIQHADEFSAQPASSATAFSAGELAAIKDMLDEHHVGAQDARPWVAPILAAIEEASAKAKAAAKQ